MDGNPPCEQQIEEIGGKPDRFKEAFKYYKSRKPPPSFENVIDFNNGESELVKKILINTNHQLGNNIEDVKPVCEWRAYTLSSLEGFLFICNPFHPAGQRKWIQTCLQDYPEPPNIMNICTAENIWKNCLLRNEKLDKLRWITLGYHHNWDTKEYDLKNCTAFPSELGKLSKFIISTMGFREWSPEAAIVNFYNSKSTLAGHTDHSEVDLGSPLLSISFGQTAVFLIGGQEKCVRPTAVFARSGDVMLMTEQSRLCYHGVPRIIITKERQWAEEEPTLAWEPFENYIQKSRINVNVRQVFPVDK